MNMFFSRPAHKVGPLLVCALIWTAYSAREAHAGHWVVDHYSFSGDFKRQEQDYTQSAGEQTAPDTDVTKRYPDVFYDDYGDEPVNYEDRTSFQNEEYPRQTIYTQDPNGEYIPGKRAVPAYFSVQASAHMSNGRSHGMDGGASASGNPEVTAYLRYERDPEDAPDSPIPRDLWIAQYSSVVVNASHWDGLWGTPAYRDTNPYMGQHFTVSGLSNGLGHPWSEWGSARQVYGGGSWDNVYAGFSTRVYGSQGTKLLHIDTLGQSTVRVPTCQMSGSVSVKSPLPVANELAEATLGFTYEVRFPNFYLSARRKGTSDSFGSSATVAVGGKNSHEHKAEILLSANVFDYERNYRPIYGAALSEFPKLRIRPGTEQGAQMSASLLGATHQENSQPEFDAGAVYNDAGIVAGMALSHDQTSDPFEVEMDTGEGNPRPRVTINGAWDYNNDWTINGQPYAWPSLFNYGEPQDLVFKPNMGEPITLHSMRFLFNDARVYELSPDQQHYDEKLYTDNDEYILYDPLGNWQYKASLGEYGTLTPDVFTDTGAGTYSSTMTVPYDSKKLVDFITPAAQDQDARYPEW